MLTYHFVVTSTRSNGTLHSANFGIKARMIENEDREQGRRGVLADFFECTDENFVYFLVRCKNERLRVMVIDLMRLKSSLS